MNSKSGPHLLSVSITFCSSLSPSLCSLALLMLDCVQERESERESMGGEESERKMERVRQGEREEAREG